MVARRQGQGRLAVVRERWLVDGIIGGLVVMDLGLSACRSVEGRSAQRALFVAALQKRREDVDLGMM